ncbi:ADP-ribosylation factor 2 [Ranunculus cassubicifolius]
MPKYDLPWKILCTVVNVQLMVEVDTDEVFTQMTLLPEKEQIEPSMEKDGLQSQADKSRVYAFSKTLTPSDTSTHGGFSVLKKHADECLPPLRRKQRTACRHKCASKFGYGDKQRN